MLMEISDSDPEFSEDDVINEACTFMLAVCTGSIFKITT